MEVALFSARPRVGGLTVVTSGAANRLFMLDATCAAWVGPLAVAVLLPVLPSGAERRDIAEGRLGGDSEPDALVQCCRANGTVSTVSPEGVACHRNVSKPPGAAVRRPLWLLQSCQHSLCRIFCRR